MKTTRNPVTVLNMIIIASFVLLFVFFLYTFLHEAGHALVGWLFGQSLTEFDVSFWDLSAHVGLAGADLTQPQLAFRSAAGTLLPLLIWVIFISLIPRRGNFTLETLKLISSLVVINTLLTWIVIPEMFTYGKAPSDDVMNFLIDSRMPPLFLSFVALILYADGWILFLSKIDGLRNEFLMFRTMDSNPFKGGRRMSLVMTGILMFCTILAIGINLSAGKNPIDKFSPPPDFVPVAQIDLSTRPYSSETINQFTLDKPGFVRVFIVVRNIDTTFFDLCVKGQDEYQDVVLHGEGYRASEDGGLWEKNLPAGTYQLVLTSDRSSGTVSIFSKEYMP